MKWENKQLKNNLKTKQLSVMQYAAYLSVEIPPAF